MRYLITKITAAAVCVVLATAAHAQVTPTGQNYWLFESGHVRPLTLSPDGNRLFAVNTPDNHLEIYDVTAQGLTWAGSVPVGLEPVAVAARTNGEVWVVNHVSDSISIVDVSTLPARVVRTLFVGDEPRDLVFAGVPQQAGDPPPRAFITTAHRGQVHPPDAQGEKYGDFFTPSVGRADVWVFDADNLGAGPGGSPETIVTLFGDTPRALVASPSGDTVYAAVFHSGNVTTISPENGPVTLPNSGGPPSIPTIVRFDGANWVDNGGNIDTSISLVLPDTDVFEIDADAPMPVEVRSFAGVGTILFNMVIDPATGNLYVSNSEANNLVPTEPGLVAELHRSRITVIEPDGTVSPRHLNKHIDYANPAGSGDDSLATPLEMAIAADGKLYVTAFGSSKIGVFDAAKIDDDSFVPGQASHIDVTGGGPSGIVLDAARNRLYVATRFDNGISIVDRATATETDHLLMHNPEPATVIDGRQFLYDARVSSTNGEASCSSCHVFGRMDDLSWDLGDPNGSIVENLNPFVVQSIGTPEFHPLKGPMVTQSLRGMDNHGPMHWRGDRSGALVSQPFDDESEAFKQFNPAFVGLLGRATELAGGEMQAFTDFVLQLAYPPNPIRNLDNSLTATEASGENLFTVPTTDAVQTCQGCHTTSPASGFFGSAGFSSFEAASQDMKVAHLRNMYQKVGMFGGVATTILLGGVQAVSTPSHGPPGQPQIRGFGYSHSGVVDSLQSFAGISLFTYPGDRQQAIEEISKFMLAFPSELAPIVGQQVTMTPANRPAADPRIDLLIARAQAMNPSSASPQQHECDLVVQGQLAGAQRNWLYDVVNDEFDPDAVGGSPLTDTELRDLVATTGELTYTCAPPGSGPRIALDRDMDGLLNHDETELHNSDPASTDTDGDGLSDNDEVNVHGTDPSLEDTDSDGLTDPEEISTTNTDPTNPDSDGDGLTDGVEVAAGTDPNDAAPVVTIMGPASASTFLTTETVTLDGTAIDAEDGDITASLQWSSDLDGLLGSGASVSASLSPGTHVIAASATDSKTATTVATVNVIVGLPGDVDDDGTLGVGDLLLMQRAVTGQLAPTPLQFQRADLHPAGGDGVLNASDLLALELLLSGP